MGATILAHKEALVKGAPFLAVLILVLAACNGSKDAGPTTSAASSSGETGVTETTSVPTYRGYLSQESIAVFKTFNARLRADLETIANCLDQGDSDCINDERNKVEPYFGAIESWPWLGPETRDNACYRSLTGYSPRYLRRLERVSEPLFAAAETGQADSLRQFATRVGQLQQEQRDIQARVLAARS
jgi:hypothetical protein